MGHKNVARDLRTEFTKRASNMLTTGFGFVGALAWNEAIKSLFAEGGALEFFSHYGRWVYALLVTLLAVFVAYAVAKVRALALQDKPKQSTPQIDLHVQTKSDGKVVITPQIIEPSKT